jgi:hypothetical protein
VIALPQFLGRRSLAIGGNDLTIALSPHFLHSQAAMRLLAELIIIGALISLGWSKPFKEQFAQANTAITTKLSGLGSKMQKHQDPSVRRY